MPYENVQTNEEFAKTLENCGFTSVDIEVVTKSVIPGYIIENRKPESRKEISNRRDLHNLASNQRKHMIHSYVVQISFVG